MTHTLETLDELLAWATRERPAHSVLLERTFGDEVAAKSEDRVSRRVQKSGLSEYKTLEGFDWDFQPSIDKSFVLELASLDFVHRHDDIVFTGDSGTGKSHILKAIALRACQQGVSMRYVRCVDLLQDLHAGLADNTYLRRLKTWVRPRLLIIDDVGLGHVRKREDEPTAAHTLYNLIDLRHSAASTAITSNIQLRDWGRYLGDASLTMAILDRLAMHALRLDIKGPSYRQHVARQRGLLTPLGAEESPSSTATPHEPS